MAVSISISITQGSQSIANNTTNVTVKVNAKWTYGSWNATSRPGWVKINGTTYNFSSSFNTGGTTSGSQTLYTKSVTVPHNSNGTKTLSCSASYSSDVSSGTVTASASKTLTTIPRKSTLTVSNGTLGTAQTLKITEKATSFNHKLTYKCGSASGYILGSSSATSSTLSQSWTPPLSLAAQNTTGTTISITFTLTTYNGSSSIGSNSYTKSFEIPTSVKPSCTVSVSDANGYASTYGGYIKGLSKFKIVVTPTTSQGSPISSYSTTANGVAYKVASFTTDVVKTVGTNTITATVKDKRGRSGSASVTANVIDYKKPSITLLKVSRTENGQGANVQVTFDSSVTALSNKNTATYKLEYKKSSASSYTAVTLSNYANNYAVSNGTYTFPAETGSSYDVKLTVTDKFDSGYKTTSASTAFTLMHWLKSGLGMAIGKIAEIEEYLDIGFKTRFRKNIIMSNGTGSNGSGVIYGEDPSSGADIAAFQPQNENGNTLVGYGNYARKSGNTNLYAGGDVWIFTGDSSTSLAKFEGDTGRLLLNRSTDCGYKTTHTSGKIISFGIGGGGINRGIYDNTTSKWQIYSDDTDLYLGAPAYSYFKPYYGKGDVLEFTLQTAGFITSSSTSLGFVIPISKPIIGNPTVTVSSINGFKLRQRNSSSGGSYTHGSSADVYAKPSKYTAAINDGANISVVATFSTTTNAVNNSPIGVYWNGKVTLS